jgi:branched-subunit amino acid transport protein
MSAWIALLVASALTLALRVGPSLIGSAALPAVFERANRFAVPALMGALASRSVAAQTNASGSIAPLIAVLLAALVAVRTRSMLLTIATGTMTQLLAAAVLTAR